MAQSRSRQVLASGPETQSVKAWAAYRAEMYGQPAPKKCPACGGLKRLRVPTSWHDEPGFGTLVHCDVCSGDGRLKWITANCGLESSELTARMHDWRLGNWKDGSKRQQREDAKDAIEWAILERRGWTTFWGDFGAGKTFALQIIVNEMCVKEIESIYASFATILDHLRSLMGQNAKSSTYWQRLLDVPVLAVDEVTRFYDTEWARERLHVLIDTRYRRARSHLTLFATNDDPREALPPTNAIGRLYSRMRQGRLVELRGDVRPAVAGDAARHCGGGGKIGGGVGAETIGGKQ